MATEELRASPLRRALRYWPEIIVFSAIALAMLNAISYDLTWANMAVDGTAYVMSAKFLYPAHHTSAPLYLLVGHLFTLIPIGTDYFRLALLSLVSAVVGVIFVYLITRKLLAENKHVRWYALAGAAVFGSSMMLISQATVVEPFTMVTTLGLAAYYFTLRKQWIGVAVMLGAGLAVHHLILIPIIVLFVFNKPLRNWKPILVMLSFVLFYLYIPITKALTDAPDMWLNTGFMSFLKDNFYTFAGLIGGLAMWDIPKRLFETFGFWIVCFTVGLIPLAWFIWKQKYWKHQLFWLFLLPFCYSAGNLDPHVSRYALGGVAFAAVIIALALSKVKPIWLYSTGLASIAMLAINGYSLDLGAHLDPNLTAAKFYYEEYPKVQDDQIMLNFLPGGEWEMAFYYNKNEGKHIIPICIGMLANPDYQALLRSQGVNLTPNDISNMTDNEMTVALSIVDQNKDVLITQPTTLRDYGAVLVPAATNKQEITRWMGHVTVAQWKFMPSNPYDILAGALDTTDWQWTLQSNKDVKFFVGLASIGLIINWFIFVLPNRKPKEMVASKEERR